MFSVRFLNVVRSAEIDVICRFLPPGSTILEIGAGTGQQARALSQRGYDVQAIELSSSNYAQEREFPIIDYDGQVIPFPDASFDVVYSSSVLEHVPDLSALHTEIARVLKPEGFALHIMPTHAWRFWTTLSYFPDAVLYAANTSNWRDRAWRLASPFMQARHGERGNVMTEVLYFHPSWWLRHFRANGFEVLRHEPMGLFYTGNMLLSDRLSLTTRQRLAGLFGSACHLFQVRPAASYAISKGDQSPEPDKAIQDVGTRTL